MGFIWDLPMENGDLMGNLWDSSDYIIAIDSSPSYGNNPQIGVTLQSEVCQVSHLGVHGSGNVGGNKFLN